MMITLYQFTPAWGIVNTTQKAQLFAEYLNNKIITYQKSSPKNDSN